MACPRQRGGRGHATRKAARDPDIHAMMSVTPRTSVSRPYETVGRARDPSHTLLSLHSLKEHPSGAPESREDRFRRLYVETYWELLAYSLRRVPESVAQDVVADTFLVLWRRLDDIPDREVLPWLYGVAGNIVMNQRRSSRRLERLRTRLLALPRPRRSGEADDTDEREIGAVLDGLRQLKDDDREVLLLSVWEGLTNEQIAAAEGCSANAVAIRVHRARKRLEHLLAKGSTSAGNTSLGVNHLGVAVAARRTSESKRGSVPGSAEGESRSP